MLNVRPSSMTIMVLCFITALSSNLKNDATVEDNNTQNSEDILNLNPIQNKSEESFRNQSQTKKLFWHAEIKVKDENINLGFFKYKKSGKRVIDKKCKEFVLKGKYLQNYSLSEKNIDELQFVEKYKLKNKTSIYDGVYWHKDSKKWQAQFKHNKKKLNGGVFDIEEHAAMKINLLCDQHDIQRKNPTVDIKADIIQQPRNPTSNYIGVSWIKDRKKWQAKLTHDKKKYYGGYFDIEEHAAMKINLLCEQHDIQRKNPTVDIKPDTIQQPRNPTSNYIGVHWHKESKKWQAQLKHNKEKFNGGVFDIEEHAAMKINLLCDQNDIQRKNPTVDIKPDTIQQPRNPTSNYIGVSWIKSRKKWQAQLRYNKKLDYGGLFDIEKHAAMKVNLLCDKYEIERKNPTIVIKPDIIQQNTKPQIDQSGKENIIKIEDESILYGFELKDKCENKFNMKTKDKKIHMTN